MKLGPVFFCLAVSSALPSPFAQAQASLGLGVGTVRYAGGSSFSAATVSPAVQRFGPSFFFASTGALSALGDGVWAAQGRADWWAAWGIGAARDSGKPQLAVSLNAAASSRSDGVAAASAYAIGEVVLPSRRPGSGVALGGGAAGGVVERDIPVTALRLRARAWANRGPTQLSLSLESTRFLGAWYSDVFGGATFDRGHVVASTWIVARLSGVYGSKTAASASVQVFVSPRLSVEAAAGSYLAEPFQGLPKAGYVSAGLRLHGSPRQLAPPKAAPPRLTPLVAARRGDSSVVRFRMDGAQTVAIAGDWNNWQPLALRPLGGAIFEAALVLPAGTYHFNLLVDGREWVVPGGVVVVSDGMGGLVALLTVL